MEAQPEAPVSTMVMGASARAILYQLVPRRRGLHKRTEKGSIPPQPPRQGHQRAPSILRALVICSHSLYFVGGGSGEPQEAAAGLVMPLLLSPSCPGMGSLE